jgi:anti-sigma factor (TIGR02949 family)
MPERLPPDCLAIDSLVTAYVDGQLSASDRQNLESHARACPPCRARIAAETAVQHLIASRRGRLADDRAPQALRAKCAALAATARDDAASRSSAAARPTAAALAAWRARLRPLALAATLVLLVGAAFLYRLTESSTRVMAAELTADHMKCFMMNTVLGTRHTPAAVEASMAARFDWHARLPEDPGRMGLELVGGRPCLYGEGRVAHIMYRHNGKPVSVFMLPKKRRPEELLHVMGHEAAIWSDGDRTFVVIAREPRSELERIAEYVQTSLR